MASSDEAEKQARENVLFVEGSASRSASAALPASATKTAGEGRERTFDQPLPLLLALFPGVIGSLADLDPGRALIGVLGLVVVESRLVGVGPVELMGNALVCRTRC